MHDLYSMMAVQMQNDLNTGIAIVKTSAETAFMELRLRDTEGLLRAAQSLSLPAGNQTARFLHELFGKAVPAQFQGTLEVVTSDEGVVCMGLLIGQGIATSIPTMHYGRMSGSMP